VLVAGVDDPSPAKDAGFKNGDLILAVVREATGAVEGETRQVEQKVSAKYVEQLPEVRRLLAALVPGKPAEFVVERKGEKLALEVVPVAKGEFEGKDFDAKRWDMTIKGISRYASPHLYFFRKKGVYIQGVRWPGNAQNSGLRTMDIIVAIDGVEVTGVEQFEGLYRKMLAEEKREKKALMTIKRGPYTKQIVLDYRRNYKDEGGKR